MSTLMPLFMVMYLFFYTTKILQTISYGPPRSSILFAQKYALMILLRHIIICNENTIYNTVYSNNIINKAIAEFKQLTFDFNVTGVQNQINVFRIFSY